MWTLSQYTQFPSWNHLFTIIGIGEIRVENGKQSRGRPVFLCIYKLKKVGSLKKTVPLGKKLQKKLIHDLYAK